jgi:soluble lytic murein transglycosylase-like protein
MNHGDRKPRSRRIGRAGVSLALCAVALSSARAAEHISLRNGFDFVCDHRVIDGDKTRLFLVGDKESYVEVQTADITSIENVVLPPVTEAAAKTEAVRPAAALRGKDQALTAAELLELLAAAGTARNLDVDLLACVVHAESGGHAHAVSRAGAQGLMQLMPKTAADLGVADSFQPSENINGGTAYLNALLLRYHDNLALALAAYNAGPKAVDRYHGVPPYRETRAYVARIIHEFNQRKLAAEAAQRKTERAANKTVSADPAHGLE